MMAARAASFGHRATPQTPERMIERKDAALRQILDLLANHGVVGSILRGKSCVWRSDLDEQLNLIWFPACCGGKYTASGSAPFCQFCGFPRDAQVVTPGQTPRSTR